MDFYSKAVILRPICRPREKLSYEEAQAKVSGWGLTGKYTKLFKSTLSNEAYKLFMVRVVIYSQPQLRLHLRLLHFPTTAVAVTVF